MTIKATAATTGGAFGLVESFIAPGFSPPLHVHRLEDESFYVLEGELTMKCGDRTFAASAGSFVFLPRNVPHTFVVEGERPARMLTLLTPGGGERVFIEGGRPAEHDGLPPATPPDIEALKRVSARYGAEIVGPPMAPTGRASVTGPR
jgi:quercetin dioxygenase-like cupin family protein